jgi:hypothetical protein
MIEGKGVIPSFPMELSSGQLLAGQDSQMQGALELAKGL